MPGNRQSWAAATAAREAAREAYELAHPKKHATTRRARHAEREVIDAEVVGEPLTSPALSPSTEVAVRESRGFLAPRADGDTITIMLLQSITGLGAHGDVLTLVQNAEIDALFALGWAALYSGPTPPTTPVVAVLTGPQTLTSGQQTQVRDNLGVTSLLGTKVSVPVSGDAVGSVPTKQSDGSIAYAVPSGSADLVDAFGRPYVSG